MAGPEVPQKGVLQTSESSFPQYQPQNIQIPDKAGDLWAGVGRMALGAAQQVGAMLQQSPLNPAVRANMDASIQAARSGIAQTKAMENLPGGLGRTVIGVDSQGHAILSAPAATTDPNLAAAFQRAMGGIVPGAGGDNKDGSHPPNVNNPANPNPDGQQPAPTTGAYGGLEERNAGAAPPPSTNHPAAPAGPPTTQQMGTAQVSPQGGGLMASTGDGSGQGNYALTPSGPDPLVERQPAANYRAQFAAEHPSGSVWSPMRAPLNAPPAPGPQDQPSTPGTTAGSLSDQYAQQQKLAQWQAQSMGMPMTADDAMEWMGQRTTLATGATYMANGGPDQSPAFAFHMKTPGGKTSGVNIVPVSQMVQNGAGPHVAAQNTSMMLSQTDKMQQQQQNALAAPPDQSQQPQIAQAPAAPTAPAGAPPAPTGPQAPITDVNGNPLSAYTNVASQGGPSQQYLSAGGDTTPPAPPPAPMWERISQEDQDKVLSSSKSMGDPPTGPYTGDRIIRGVTGPYTYYRQDDSSKPYFGRAYTVLPGKAGEYFNQQRWYVGSPNYETYELPDSQLKADVANYWIPTGEGPNKDEIDKMKSPELKVWARQAWLNRTLTPGPPDQGTNQTLNVAEQSHNNLTTISDIMQTLKAHGIDANSLGLQGSKVRTALSALKGGWIPTGMDEKSAKAYQDLAEAVDQEQNLLKANPQLLQVPGRSEGIHFPEFKPVAGTDIPLPSTPDSDALSDAAFGIGDVPTRLSRISGMQKNGDRVYKNVLDGAQSNWMRVDNRHVDNMARLSGGRSFTGDDNPYHYHSYPGDLPTISPAQYPEFAKNHPGEAFKTQGGVPGRVPVPVPR